MNWEKWIIGAVVVILFIASVLFVFRGVRMKFKHRTSGSRPSSTRGQKILPEGNQLTGSSDSQPLLRKPSLSESSDINSFIKRPEVSRYDNIIKELRINNYNELVGVWQKHMKSVLSNKKNIKYFL